MFFNHKYTEINLVLCYEFLLFLNNKTSTLAETHAFCSKPQKWFNEKNVP